MVNEKRRDFLKLSSVTAAMVASQGHIFAKTEPMIIENGKEDYPNTSYSEKMYRNEFGFTFGKKEEHGFAYHCVNCQGNCAWEIWSTDGVITRENQSARYPSINARIPDINPRGCNKGVQHSQMTYEKDRILYPMKRVGERGEGNWKRISWDEAATEVAQKIFDTMTDPEKGPGKLLVQASTGLLTEGRRGGPLRFGTQLGANRIYPASYLGDMFSGAAVAFGEGNVGCTFDFFYNVDVAVFWGNNANVTRIPDAHYLWEGRYNGAKIIVITPEFNGTAKSADLWVPIKVGTDNILAMSVINEIIESKIYKPEFMKIYTDLPFLVRVDNKKLLRRSDLEHTEDKELHHKYEEEFYCMNSKTGAPALMPGTEGSEHHTIRLKEFDISPELEGRWKITDSEGKEIEVTTAFEMLKAEASKFSAEKTQEITGVHPSIVKQLAQDISLPKVTEITAGFSLNKHHNGILNVWNISSICGLAGRLGPYGGLNTENEFQLTGLGVLSGFNGKYKPRFGSGFVGEFVLGKGLDVFKEYFNDSDVKRATNGISKSEYVQIIEAMLEKGKDGKQTGAKPHWLPEVTIAIGDSRFRRNKSQYREEFLKQMEYFALVDFRFSDSAFFADILLPAKSHYEVWDIRSSPGYHRFTNLAQPVKNLKPIGEALDEWTMFTLIAKKIEEIANKAENIDKAKVSDPDYTTVGFRDLTIFHQEFTNTDEDSEADMEPYLGTDKQAVQAALEKCEQYEPYTIEKMYKTGGFLQLNEKAAKTSPLYSDRPFNTLEDHLFKFERFETLSGRQTFYVDHELWIRVGANVNTGIQNIAPIDRFPFILMTPHARWSIHSTFKVSRTLQRLQRGKPYIAINRDIAKIKGIKDGDNVKIYNSLGEFEAMAKVSSSAPHDAVVMEHGWEPYMFKNLKAQNEVLPNSLNLLEMADGWGHLRFGALWDGNQYAYDGAVDIKKV